MYVHAQGSLGRLTNVDSQTRYKEIDIDIDDSQIALRFNKSTWKSSNCGHQLKYLFQRVFSKINVQAFNWHTTGEEMKLTQSSMFKLFCQLSRGQDKPLTAPFLALTKMIVPKSAQTNNKKSTSFFLGVWGNSASKNWDSKLGTTVS